MSKKSMRRSPSSRDERRSAISKKQGFNPDWTIPPEPKGDDEDEVRLFYEENVPAEHARPWEMLEEFKRESWRREYRK